MKERLSWLFWLSFFVKYFLTISSGSNLFDSESEHANQNLQKSTLSFNSWLNLSSFQGAKRIWVRFQFKLQISNLKYTNYHDLYKALNKFIPWSLHLVSTLLIHQRAFPLYSAKFVDDSWFLTLFIIISNSRTSIKYHYCSNPSKYYHTIFVKLSIS